MAQARRSPDDQYLTETSDLQAETESILLKHLPLDPESPPPLQRQQHLQFLVRNLVQGFPSRYVSQDASQPWLLYWTLQGFCALGVTLDPDNKQRCAPPFSLSLVTMDFRLSLVRSTRFWRGSIPRVGLVVGQARRRISFPLMPLCVRLRSLADRGPEGAGTRSTGVCSFLLLRDDAALVLAAALTHAQRKALCVLHVAETARRVVSRRPRRRG